MEPSAFPLPMQHWSKISKSVHSSMQWPGRRRSHAATCVSHPVLVMLGGYGRWGLGILSEWWICDTTTMLWKKVEWLFIFIVHTWMLCTIDCSKSKPVSMVSCLSIEPPFVCYIYSTLATVYIIHWCASSYSIVIINEHTCEAWQYALNITTMSASDNIYSWHNNEL